MFSTSFQLGANTGVAIIAVAIFLSVGIGFLLVRKFSGATPIADEYVMRWRKWFLSQIAIGVVFVSAFAAFANSGVSWAFWILMVIAIVAYAYSLYKIPKRTKTSSQ